MQSPSKQRKGLPSMIKKKKYSRTGRERERHINDISESYQHKQKKNTRFTISMVCLILGIILNIRS